ncbi:GDP-mannose 4,6-dehydratase [Asticcacaulis sp. 201]|uniref:GDP-mannose 4,6-dehydratase n=1 Tax=Asticcacaulis sp. 201 TaxID=3028787 RepID=UPI002916EFDA|nr:GDP-mannose 4,6-dehydratase [Asticcacaulis sp. 201]MDV6331044.1 GDP-mannose 4,6-dehydratase [Asticcacaulis sp. 201]
MKKRVLITGAAGFAGRHLVPLMSGQGFDVVGTSHDPVRANVDGFCQLLPADLLNFDEVMSVVREVRPTHVVHLAAISFVAHEDVREIYDVNIVGTRNLLRALVEMPEKPDGVLLTSSANVYGNSDREVLAETDVVNPANDYAVSKLGMELMSRQFVHRMNVMIARPFNYTGRGQAGNFLVPKIVDHFKSRQRVIELGNVDVSRDFSDVRSVVAYLARLLELPQASGQVYNICSGRPVSLQSIIDICERISGHKIEVIINPKFQRANDVKMLVGNPHKLHAVAGVIDTFTMEDTLRWMLDSEA